MHTDEAPQTTAAKLGEVRQYLSSLSPDLLAEAFANHYADQADKTNEVRRATLAKFLPRLNDRLKDEIQGLLHFQQSISDEDKTNSEERALGRAFNKEIRRMERSAILHNLHMTRMRPEPKDATEEELDDYRKRAAMAELHWEESLRYLRNTGHLVPREKYQKQVVPPRRNLRREEAKRRVEMIRELTQFCEVVEKVVRGTKIVTDEALDDLIQRARVYLDDIEAEAQGSEESKIPFTREYMETQEYKDFHAHYYEGKVPKPSAIKQKHLDQIETQLGEREKYIHEQEAKYGEDWYISEDRARDLEAAHRAKARGQSP